MRKTLISIEKDSKVIGLHFEDELPLRKMVMMYGRKNLTMSKMEFLCSSKLCIKMTLLCEGVEVPDRLVKNTKQARWTRRRVER